MATIPDDLLVVIYSMIASPRGRACFAAVCRSWRAAARVAPPVAPLPWLLLSPHDGDMINRLHCPEDGTFVDSRSMPAGTEGRLMGGHDGGWVILYVRSSLRILNLFSGVEVMLAKKQVRLVCGSRYLGTHEVFPFKIVFSEPPTSSSCILAAITMNCGVALCRVGCADGGWTVQGCPRANLTDITFCNGELYGLHYGRAPSKFDIGVNDDGAPVITAEHRLATQNIDRPNSWDYYMDYANYIFDLQGKLAMASIHRWLPNLQPFFKVFKFVDICTHGPEAHCKHMWMEMTSLGEHALFWGEKFSKAVHVPANMRGGVKTNCIYYLQHRHLNPNVVVLSDKIFLTISNGITDKTYYKEDDMKNDVAGDDLKRIRSVGYYIKGSARGGMWIVPPHI